MLKIGDNEPILIKARPKFGKDINFIEFTSPVNAAGISKNNPIFFVIIFFMEHLNLKYESYHTENISM